MRFVALGFSCNNACVFCAQGELRARVRVDPAAIEAAIDETRPGEVVALVGGEPTLHEALPRWIARAAELGAERVIVQTNGRRLAYRSYAAELAGSGQGLALDVSLHGSTEAMHDYHTSVDGSFKQTVRGLYHARAERIPVGVSVRHVHSNYRHLVEIVRVAQAAGARAVNLALAEPAGAASRASDRVVPAIELARPHVLAAVDEARRLGMGVLVGEQASDPSVASWFAGIGEQEPAAPAEPAPGQAKVSLTVLGKPTPARAEVRSAAKRTGHDLRAIFPALFGQREAS